MKEGGIKGIVISIILVILCFVVGSQAAGNALASATVLAAILGGFVIMILGVRSWALLFLLPPVFYVIPLPGAFAKLDGRYYVVFLVYAYWLIMWAMGYVKLRWRSMVWVDLVVLVFAVYMVISYLRNPVSISFLGLETDKVGGASYVTFIGSIIFYLALSTISIEGTDLVKVMRRSVVVVFVFALVAVLIKLRGGMESVGGATSEVDTLRIRGIWEVAKFAILSSYSMFPLCSIILNPVLLGSISVAFAALLMGGSRQAFAEVSMELLLISVTKREILYFVVIGFVTYAGLLVLSLGGGLQMLPKSASRILTLLPGVQLRADAIKDAEGTWRWREEAWGLARDKRTGYIIDYTFGDGFGISSSLLDRIARAEMRGQIDTPDKHVEIFAAKGMWHNGALNVIHRLGYVGLVIVVIFSLVGSYYVIVACMSMRDSALGCVAAFYLVDFLFIAPLMMWGAHGVDVILEHISTLAILKFLYTEAKERRMVIPFVWRQRYVPQMIQAYGNRIRQQ